MPGPWFHGCISNSRADHRMQPPSPLQSPPILLQESDMKEATWNDKAEACMLEIIQNAGEWMCPAASRTVDTATRVLHRGMHTQSAHAQFALRKGEGRSQSQDQAQFVCTRLVCMPFWFASACTACGLDAASNEVHASRLRLHAVCRDNATASLQAIGFLIIICLTADPTALFEASLSLSGNTQSGAKCIFPDVAPSVFKFLGSSESQVHLRRRFA